MPHRFDSPLQITGQGRLVQARGPVDTGQEMFWILALIWQYKNGKYAAAWGRGDWPPPNGKAPKWHCQTTMVGPDPFVAGSAEAWALAWVTDGGGKFHSWKDTVNLV
jgi:hypothetical protein